MDKQGIREDGLLGFNDSNDGLRLGGRVGCGGQLYAQRRRAVHCDCSDRNARNRAQGCCPRVKFVFAPVIVNVPEAPKPSVAGLIDVMTGVVAGNSLLNRPAMMKTAICPRVTAAVGQKVVVVHPPVMPSKPRSVHRGQDRPVFHVLRCFKQGLNLGFAENDGQLLFVARQRHPVDLDSAAQRVLIEKPKSAEGLYVVGELYPFLIEQEELIGADFLRAPAGGEREGPAHHVRSILTLWEACAKRTQQDSGSSSVTRVKVQVLSSAPNKIRYLAAIGNGAVFISRPTVATSSDV
jgi:hypothetical protein